MHTPNQAPLRDGWMASLVTLHDTPGRHYHTLDHVREVVDHWNTVREAGLWTRPTETWVAAALHDAVYVVGAKDNEARSAELVDSWVSTWIEGPVDVAYVRALIEATAHHGQAVATDADAALFLDCDLAILGASEARFDRYEAQVAAEWVPVVGADAYLQGRRRFVEGLVGTRLFQSEYWGALREQPAHHNLRRLQRQLSSRRSPETSGTQ